MENKNILAYQQSIGVTIDALAGEIRTIAEKVSKNPCVTFRVKDAETLRRKMKLEKVDNVFLIDDVYGIRVITESEEEAYRVLGRVADIFPGYLDHDYFKTQKPCPSVGGKVLRFLQFIACRSDVPFEIQITTIACHEVNESLHTGYHNRKYHKNL